MPTDTEIEALAAQFIRELKDRTYVEGRLAGNIEEGDFGRWSDWQAALVEFAKRAGLNTTGRE